MDEQRMQAYMALIEQLLNCSNGEETEILEANRELLDQSFLEAGSAIVEQLRTNGNIEADRLVGLLQQLSEVILRVDGTEREFTSDSATLEFVEELLQLVADSEGKPDQVYSFLAANQERLDLALLHALLPAFNVLIASNTDYQYFIAGTFGTFANLIREFPLGQQWLNLELAIQSYQLVLQVYTCTAFPMEWAGTHNNLANALKDRIWGNRAENLELAIQSYQLALKVHTRTDFPVNWAMIQNNLATVYRNRIRGNRAENLELAIQSYQFTLQILTRAEFPVNWAMTQKNLAVAYSYRIHGDQAENLEMAIQSCELALQVYTHTTFPVEWAGTHNNLATVYKNRIHGDQAENLEMAIQSCELALQVYTRADFPVDWAMAQNNLANAYSNRIRGERAENLELAIQSCELALQVYTRAAFPVKWAGTHNNLASIYNDRIRGDQAKNLELAIQSCELALQVHTRSDFPVEWAMTQNNLAIAYSDRIRGDQAENLELAIQSYQLIFQIYTRTGFPVDWARTQSHLATAYILCIRGDRAENLELAIQSCELALQVYTRTGFPMEWARTQRYLAIAYLDRICGDRAENLELAIQSCELALQVHTRAAFPVEWAATQSNLASIYTDRIRGDRAENLELAIQSYQLILQIYTRTGFPVNWARAQNGLATAFWGRIRGERADNLKQAISAYHNALELHQPEAFPLDCLKISRNLGDLRFREGDWTEAVDAYELALQGLDQARHWAATDDRRQELQDEAASVYTNLIQSYVHLERYGKALETVERSRSQRLVHLMASQDYYAQTGISPDLQTLLTRYDSLQTQINQLQRQQATLAQTRGRAALSAHSQEIHTLETQKQTLRQQISRLDPVSAGIIQVSPIDLATLQTLIPRSTCALLSFYITPTDTHIFILKQTQITCHTCPNQGDALRDWLFETWLKPYAEINAADTEDDRSQRRQAWITQMPDLLRELVDRLNLPELIQTYLQAIDDLILVPHLLLHQIPFAALPLGSGYLSDRFTLRQVPSTQILKFCHDRPPLQPTAYGTVEDATDDLPCSSFEGDQIAHLYNIPTTQRLRGSQQATVPNYLTLLPQVQTLLSSHHAHSRLDNPLESSLQLGDGSITLGNLISPAIRLPDLADIFLSCCETGLSHNLGQSDEPLSLASGFLYAGARNVVSTLWAVDDLATAIFSIRYHHHRQSHTRSIALKHAQTDLRTISGTHLKQQYAKEIDDSLKNRLDHAYKQVKLAQAACDQGKNSPDYPQLEETYKFWRIVQRRIHAVLNELEDLCRCDRPFEHPVYWSGFVCQGLE